MGFVVALSLLTPVRNEAENFNGLPSYRSRNSSLPHLSIRKVSWVVRTESNVRRKVRKKPDPPCVVCEGSGRVDCHCCQGRGRTNRVDMEMLPKGEWPSWCKTCGGSGLTYCSRCLGSGEYRGVMGFHFMKKENNESQ
ncbi:unnamed protein product [Lathyrus oleraceus]|uniref:Uncharacterized protein n=1 Tax=Pisum sativum TaxID=3888 RepID=A0A9D4Y701_PEA|nr:hypothetical protein KIW84_020677 [Pisum sativum]